ncbi:heterokaryon incompatibility protein-domain-containing protein, partial [Immersiella caudata]
RYAILSYVWGTDPSSFRAVRDNIDQLHIEIPPSALPLTLQHIFRLVRHLSLAYLWVDALCILQDDRAEQDTEISNMASTYLNAYLQISATSSPGARHVCRSLRQSEWDSTLFQHYRLLTRGWTFQERILARRVVHFTGKELVWECKTGRWCDYSKRNLGKASDRLPAISGIAALLLPGGRDGEGEYVAGLWREAMPFELLW